MHEGTPVNMGELVKWGLSTTVALLMAAAWIAWFAGTESAWMMLGLTACATSAAAAVAHVRCYAVRICDLVRVNLKRISDLERDSSRPRPLH